MIPSSLRITISNISSRQNSTLSISSKSKSTAIRNSGAIAHHTPPTATQLLRSSFLTPQSISVSEMETTVQCTNRRQHPIPWRRSPSTSSPSFLTSPPGLPVAGKRNYLVEIQAVLALLMLVSVKFVKEENWEAFIGDALFYAKVLLLAVTSVIDYHLSLCYLLTFIVIFVVTQQPPYAGLGYI